MIENPIKSQKYHKECAKLATAEYTKKYREENKKEEEFKPKRILNVCDSNCKDCCHSSKSGGICVCLYILDTGKRRPCKGGAGCTVKEIGNRAKELALALNV
ncbi:hypothetical protein MHBO_005266 [Bonamia ostreae]|uniref:Uncharacterized protein n=1 Tax=Bonamia ostreae TaxID=126728 RepID=A0ABV2AWS6_9EUKA